MARKIICYRAKGDLNDWQTFGSTIDGRPLTIKECKAICQRWVDSGEWNYVALMYGDSTRILKHFRPSA